MFTPMLAPPSFYNYSQPSSSAVLTPAEVPTAFLDVDLVLLRANQPFQQIMNAGSDIKGRHISELVAPADNEAFQSIRSRLRGEREAREPAYMLPIVQSSQDPVQGVSEADIERLSSGFAEYTYTWRRILGGTEGEIFPARVRMGKTTAYFVIVTLPSFRPTGSIGPSAGSMNPWPPPPQTPTPVRAQYWPGQPLSSPTYPPPLQPSFAAQSYPAQRMTTHEQSVLPSMQRPSPPQGAYEGTLASPSGNGRLQQPPTLLSQPATTRRSSVMESAEFERRARDAAQMPASYEEPDDDRSPKRRRMGIQDVLR